MDKAFREYLWDFLKLYSKDPAGINFDHVSDFDSMLEQLASSDIDVSDIKNHLKVIFELHKKKIYIYDVDYKTTQQYLKEKDIWIPDNKGGMISVENYIERFLLDKNRLYSLYCLEKDTYAMGSPYKLDKLECKLVRVLRTTHESLLNDEDDEDDENLKNNGNGEKKKRKRKKNKKEEEVIFDSDTTIADMIREASCDFAKMLLRGGELNDRLEIRWGGLVKRLEIHLGFDITKYFSKEEYDGEICKIIYFFLKLEHTPIVPKLQGKKIRKPTRDRYEPYFDLIEFLRKPSIENVGYAYLKRRTYNGKIIDLIKCELEKEMALKEKSLDEIAYIKDALRYVTDTWEGLLANAYNAIEMDKEFPFDEMNSILDSIINKPKSFEYEEIMRCYGFPRRKKGEVAEQIMAIPKEDIDYIYNLSPVALLYLIVSQFEYLGEIQDKDWACNIEIDYSDDEYQQLFDVPQKFVDKMNLYKNQLIDDECDIRSYIIKNIENITECVYLKSKTTQAERRRIIRGIDKVQKVLDYCIYAGKIVKAKSEISKLLIISCFQAILSQRKNDEEYDFYDCQYHLGTNQVKIRIPKDKPQMPGLHLLDDQIPLDAIKLGFARFVEEHWYSNTGKKERYHKLKVFESNLYEILCEKIYTCRDVLEMKEISDKFYDALRPIGVALDR